MDAPTRPAMLCSRLALCALHLHKRKGFAGRSAEVDGRGSRRAGGAVGMYLCGQEPLAPDAAQVLRLASCQAAVGLLTLAVGGHTSFPCVVFGVVFRVQVRCWGKGASALAEDRKEVKFPHLAPLSSQQAAIWKCSARERTWIRAGQAARVQKPHFLLAKTWEEQVRPPGDLLPGAAHEHPLVPRFPRCGAGTSEGTQGCRNGEDALWGWPAGPSPREARLERAAAVSSWQMVLIGARGIKKEGRDQEQQQADG